MGGGGLEDQNPPPSTIPQPLDIADLDTHSYGRQVALALARGTQTFLGNEDGPPPSRLASLIMQYDFPRASAPAAICCLPSFVRLY